MFLGLGLGLIASGGGSQALAFSRFGGRAQGAVFNFADDHHFEDTGHYGSVRIKDTGTPANNYDSYPFGKITNTSPGYKLLLGPQGLYRYQAHNLFLNSAAAVTQNVVCLVGATYVVSITGSGSITLSGAGTGTVTDGSPVTITAATVTLTCTVSGSPTTVHVRRTPSDSKYLQTAGAVVFDLPFTWDANGRLRGLLRENSVQPRILYSRDFDNAAWTKANITVSANAVADITGETKGDRLTASASNGTISQNLITLSTNAARVGSVFCKRVTGSGDVTLEMGASSTVMALTSAWQRFSVLGAGVTGTYSATGGAYTVTAANHGLNTGEAIRFDATSGTGDDASVTVTVSDANTYTFTNGSATSSGNCTTYPCVLRIKLAVSGDAVDVCFANANVPTFADARNVTSPIEIFGTSLTRPGDNLSIATSEIPLSATQMTLGGCFESEIGDAQPAVEIQAASRGDSLTSITNGATFSIFSGSVAAFSSQHNLLMAGLPVGSYNRIAASSAANDFRAYRDGEHFGAEDTSGNFQATAFAKLCFGGLGTGLSNPDCVIEEVFYFPQTSTNSELSRLCKPVATDEIANSIHLLGDSFLNDVNVTSRLHLGLTNKRRTITKDGVGGSNLAQQKIRFDGTPQWYSSVLVIVDGGHTDDLAAAQAALQAMIAKLTHNRWVLVEGGYDITDRAAGSPLRTTIDAFYAWIVSTYGAAHFCPTLDYLQTFSTGDANDLADIAADVVPRSQTTDGLHLSATAGGGHDNYAHQIIEHILAQGW